MHVLILNGNPIRFIAQKMIFGRTMIFIAVMQKGETMDDLIIDTNGLDEEIRCEMCKNPMHTDRG